MEEINVCRINDSQITKRMNSRRWDLHYVTQQNKYGYNPTEVC